MELLALSDHDTVDGVDEALEAAAAHGLGLVPATELSAIDGEREDLHVLGYGHRPPQRARSSTRSQGFRADRERARAPHGRRAARGRARARRPRPRRAPPVGRPHLAQAAFEHPANRMRLREEENLVNFSQLLEAYLIPGAPGVPPAHDADRRRGDRRDPRRRRRRGLGAPVLGRRRGRRGRSRSIDRFAADGLDGVEAFYVTHTEEQTAPGRRRTAPSAACSPPARPTSTAPTTRASHAFRAFDLYGLEPDLGPIRSGMA